MSFNSSPRGGAARKKGVFIIVFIDILSYIGFGILIGGLALFFSFIFSRRPTQMLLEGDNVLMRRAAAQGKQPIGEGEVSKEESSDPDNWSMTFNIIKRRGRGDWHKAFWFSVGEAAIAAAVIYASQTHLSMMKCLGLAALTGIGLFLLMEGIGRLIRLKLPSPDSRLTTQYFIFTIIVCALIGGSITALLASWGWFEFILTDALADFFTRLYAIVRDIPLEDLIQ